jgi:hypothetical protein
LSTAAAKLLRSCELNKIAVIAAQHFAAELRRKDGYHTQTAPFPEICLEGWNGKIEIQ